MRTTISLWARLSYSKVSILSLESKHIISSNNNCADFNNLIIIIVSVGYSLRVGFEPTYFPLQVGTFSPIELPEHIRPFGRNNHEMFCLCGAVGPAIGFEPTTYWVWTSCSCQLSYTGIKTRQDYISAFNSQIINAWMFPTEGRIAVSAFNMVPRTGFEPVIFCLKGRGLGPLA